MSINSNLEKSKGTVGKLRKVVITKDGRIIDGEHRLDVDPTWGVEVWDGVKTDEDYWKVRAHLNYTRRNATENRQEKLRIINSLAKIYMEQGLRVTPRNELLNTVIKALDGAIPAEYIRQNIDSKYNWARVRQRSSDKKRYRGTPEDAIRSRFGEERKEHAEQIIADLKAELREDLKEQIEEEITPNVREEIKKELQDDAHFIIDAAETIMKGDKLRHEPEVVNEYYEPIRIEKQLERLKDDLEKRVVDIDEEQCTGPDADRLKEIRKIIWIKQGLKSVKVGLHRVECPITGNPGETDLIFRESGLTIQGAITECDKRLEQLGCNERLSKLYRRQYYSHYRSQDFQLE